MEKMINNLEEMMAFSAFFIKELKPKKNKAVIVGLFGDLGSGKTTFVQSVAKVLKIENHITSPTFVIQKRYGVGLHGFDFKNLIHIDAYRLGSGKELLTLGWEEIVNDSKNIIFIEWPEKVADILIMDIEKIYFKFINEETREISYEKTR